MMRRVIDWWIGRPAVAAAAIYVVLSLLFVGQGLLPGRTQSPSDILLSSVPWQQYRPVGAPGLGANFELTDAAVQLQPFLRYTRRTAGTTPLWNPYIMAGRPLLADGQSAELSPFTWLSYLLPFWKALTVVAALKLFLASFGMFLFARALGMRFGGALFSGIVYAFGTFFVVWLTWPLTAVFAWIPWALLAIEYLVRRPGPLTAAALAAPIALQWAGGHPESSFDFMFSVTVYFILRVLIQRRKEGGALLRPAVVFIAAMVVGTGLVAAVLVPFSELILHSGDWARRTHTPAGHWPTKYLGALFLHDYWGRPTQTDLVAFMQVRGWYAGAMTLMLAVAALIWRRTALRLALVGYMAFCVCMIIGVKPIFSLVTRVPGFAASHNERLLIWFLACLALLAGFGLDDLCDRELPKVGIRRLVTGAAAVIFVIPIVWMLKAHSLVGHSLSAALKVAWGFQHPPLPPPFADPQTSSVAPIVRDSALLIWLPLAAAGLVLIAWRLWPRRRLGVVPFAGLAALLIVADLFRANMGFNPAIPIARAAPPVTGAISYLRTRVPNRFVGISTSFLSQPLPADTAMDFGLYDARGYDYPVEKRFDALWRRSVAPHVGDFTQPVEFASATPQSIHALSLFSVADLIYEPLDPPPPGLPVAYRGSDAAIYANPAALPRTFVVNRQETVHGEAAALDAVTAPSFDGHGLAVTEHAIAGIPQAASAAPAPGATASLRSYGAQRVVIDATTPDTGLLVLTDDFYPGWKVTVDGHSEPIEHVDYVLRGVRLAPGHHTVEFRYQPLSWRIGWIISLISLVAITAAAAVGLLAKRRSRASAAAA